MKFMKNNTHSECENFFILISFVSVMVIYLHFFEV